MLFRTEILKIKHNFILWLIVTATFLVPLLTTLDFIDHAKDVIASHSDPWPLFWKEAIKGFTVFVGPLVIIMTTCMYMNIEHKYNAWKYLLTLPLQKSTVYVNKLLMALLLLSLLYVLFLLFFFLDGILLGLAFPQMGFLHHQPDIGGIFYLAGRTWTAFLGILAIHFWLSFRIKNMFINIGIGLTGICIAVLLFRKMEQAVYFPYIDGLLTVFYQYPGQHLFAKNEIYSLCVFLFLTLLSYFDFTKRFRG
ncbi:ABC transporter permease subunit [Chitinophaga sp. G-6-1-13]|uniref:ABC transporter permease subunit n=1 Tax=Chitinophaga fulva TaxID=2728842 RepID=A0A848GSE1_9BACT|nr:ABC transporter permease [Chitinophaga fulva]NML40032.1 ABC transporter permease subunit [Chitinophaga fulva]